MVKLKGGEILKGTARLRLSKAGGISRYFVEAFTDCTSNKGGDYRSAANTKTGYHAHHLSAKQIAEAEVGRAALLACCIGINSALNILNLKPNKHLGQGLHTKDNQSAISKKLDVAKQKGCDAVIKTLDGIRKNGGHG